MEQSKILIYQTDDGHTQIDVRLENDTVWLNTKQMSSLFDREESNIRRHILGVFKEGELVRKNNVHFLHVNGVKKPVPFYNLDAIISVGYRVKSKAPALASGRFVDKGKHIKTLSKSIKPKKNYYGTL